MTWGPGLLVSPSPIISAHHSISYSTVNQSPQITNTSARVTIGLRGDSQQFTCMATGLPLPTISWFNGNDTLTTDDKYIINSTTEGLLVTSILTILDLALTDTSIFSCYVTNSEGTTSFNFNLTIEGRHTHMNVCYDI